MHKKYIAGAHRAPLQLRTPSCRAVYDRPGFFVQSLAEEGRREALEWSVRPKHFADPTTPAAPSAHPPLLCEEGNVDLQMQCGLVYFASNRCRAGP